MVSIKKTKTFFLAYILFFTFSKGFSAQKEKGLGDFLHEQWEGFRNFGKDSYDKKQETLSFEVENFLHELLSDLKSSGSNRDTSDWVSDDGINQEAVYSAFSRLEDDYVDFLQRFEYIKFVMSENNLYGGRLNEVFENVENLIERESYRILLALEAKQDFKNLALLKSGPNKDDVKGRGDIFDSQGNILPCFTFGGGLGVPEPKAFDTFSFGGAPKFGGGAGPFSTGNFSDPFFQRQTTYQIVRPMNEFEIIDRDISGFKSSINFSVFNSSSLNDLIKKAFERSLFESQKLNFVLSSLPGGDSSGCPSAPSLGGPSGLSPTGPGKPPFSFNIEAELSKEATNLLSGKIPKEFDATTKKYLSSFGGAAFASGAQKALTFSKDALIKKEEENLNLRQESASFLELLNIFSNDFEPDFVKIDQITGEVRKIIPTCSQFPEVKDLFEAGSDSYLKPAKESFIDSMKTLNVKAVKHEAVVDSAVKTIGASSFNAGVACGAKLGMAVENFKRDGVKADQMSLQISQRAEKLANELKERGLLDNPLGQKTEQVLQSEDIDWQGEAAKAGKELHKNFDPELVKKAFVERVSIFKLYVDKKKYAEGLKLENLNIKEELGKVTADRDFIAADRANIAADRDRLSSALVEQERIMHGLEQDKEQLAAKLKKSELEKIGLVSSATSFFKKIKEKDASSFEDKGGQKKEDFLDKPQVIVIDKTKKYLIELAQEQEKTMHESAKRLELEYESRFLKERVKYQDNKIAQDKFKRKLLSEFYDKKTKLLEENYAELFKQHKKLILLCEESTESIIEKKNDSNE